MFFFQIKSTGILRQGQLGELLFAYGPFDNIRMQNVQIAEEFHHNSTSAAKELGQRSSIDVFVTLMERHSRLFRKYHGNGNAI